MPRRAGFLTALFRGQLRPSILALVMLCLAVLLPGFFTIPPIDRDEARFAQASRQMFEALALPTPLQDPRLHGGGLWVPMLGDQPRLNKPPLVYWVQSASAAIFTGGRPERDAIWMYRVPGALAMIVTVLLTYRLGRRLYSPRVGLVAGALLAVCPLVVFDAHQARADQLLLATTTATLYFLDLVWHAPRYHPVSLLRGRQREHAATESLSESPTTQPPALIFALGFWICLALSILAKGPIGPMIVALTVLGLCGFTGRWRWLRDLRPGIGILIVLLFTLPWVLLVARFLAERAQLPLWHGILELLGSAFQESAGRAAGSREHPFLPPGFHFVLLAVLFWPGSLLTLAALVRAVRRVFAAVARGAAGVATAGVIKRIQYRWIARDRRALPETFLLAWLIPAWIVFELSGAKLPHYPMPLYPAVALLTARLLRRAVSTDAPELFTRGAAVGRWLWLVIGVGLFGAAIATAYGPLNLGVTIPGWALTPLAIGLCTALLAAAICSRFTPARRAANLRALLGLGIASAVALSWLVCGGVMPSLFSLASRVAATLPADAGVTTPVAAFGYQEDSLLFLSRARIKRLPESDLRTWLAAHPDGLAIIPDRLVHAVPRATTLAQVRGYNPGNSRVVTVLLVTARPALANAQYLPLSDSNSDGVPTALRPLVHP